MPAQDYPGDSSESETPRNQIPSQDNNRKRLSYLGEELDEDAPHHERNASHIPPYFHGYSGSIFGQGDMHAPKKSTSDLYFLQSPGNSPNLSQGQRFVPAPRLNSVPSVPVGHGNLAHNPASHGSVSKPERQSKQTHTRAQSLADIYTTDQQGLNRQLQPPPSHQGKQPYNPSSNDYSYGQNSGGLDLVFGSPGPPVWDKPEKAQSQHDESFLPKSVGLGIVGTDQEHLPIPEEGPLEPPEQPPSSKKSSMYEGIRDPAIDGTMPIPEHFSTTSVPTPSEKLQHSMFPGDHVSHDPEYNVLETTPQREFEKVGGDEVVMPELAEEVTHDAKESQRNMSETHQDVMTDPPLAEQGGYSSYNYGYGSHIPVNPHTGMPLVPQPSMPYGSPNASQGFFPLPFSPNPGLPPQMSPNLIPGGGAGGAGGAGGMGKGSMPASNLPMMNQGFEYPPYADIAGNPTDPTAAYPTAPPMDLPQPYPPPPPPAHAMGPMGPMGPSGPGRPPPMSLLSPNPALGEAGTPHFDAYWTPGVPMDSYSQGYGMQIPKPPPPGFSTTPLPGSGIPRPVPVGSGPHPGGSGSQVLVQPSTGIPILDASGALVNTGGMEAKGMYPPRNEQFYGSPQLIPPLPPFSGFPPNASHYLPMNPGYPYDTIEDPDNDGNSSLMSIPGPDYDSSVEVAWDNETTDDLMRLLELGERHKWKYMSEALSHTQDKRIPLRACKNKFESMFGEAECSSLLHSSLFYIAYRSGWEAIKNERTFEERGGEPSSVYLSHQQLDDTASNFEPKSYENPNVSHMDSPDEDSNG